LGKKLPQGYACIEAIRQTAIGFRRAGAEQAPVVKRELDTLLNELPIAQASTSCGHSRISRIW